MVFCFGACLDHVAAWSRLFVLAIGRSLYAVTIAISINLFTSCPYVYYYSRLNVNVNSKIEIKRKYAKVFLLSKSIRNCIGYYRLDDATPKHQKPKHF